jgi:hypothetical protein
MFALSLNPPDGIPVALLCFNEGVSGQSLKGFSAASQTFSGMAHGFEKTIFQNPM